MALFDQGIATGHNASLGDIDRFVDLNAGDGVEFPAARVLGSYAKGDKVLRGDLSLSFEGMETCKLKFEHLTPEQLDYLNTTYCSGNYYGDVTLYLNLVKLTDYDLYNCTIYIPQQSDLAGQYDPVLNDYAEVEVTVLNLEVISVSFQSAELTTNQYADMRSDHQTDWLVIFCPNEVVFQARVNQASFDTSFAQVTYDGVTVGAYTDALEGFVVYISHTSSIRDAFFTGRVRKVPTSSILYINETSLAISDDDYIFVTQDPQRLSEIYPHDDNGTVKFDFDIAFRKLLPVCRNVQTVYYKRLSSGVADFDFAPDWLAAEAGASIASYSSSLDGGSYQSGSSSTQNFTARYTSAGIYYPRLSATDSGGRANWFSPMVIVNDDANSVVAAGAEVNGISRKSSSATLTIKSDLDAVALLDNTQVVVISEQRYGTGRTDPVLSNIVYIGRIRDEDNQLNVNFRSGLSSSVSFKLEGLAAQMGRLILASIAMQRVASSVSFGQVTALTLWRAIVLIATELMTLSHFTSLSFSDESEDYGVPLLGADSRSVGDSLQETAFAINAFMKFSPAGEMKISRHVAYLSSTGKSSLPVVANYSMADWNESLRVHREHVLSVGRIMAYGGGYNTSSGKTTALRAIAPSRIFSSGAGRNEINKQVLKVNLSLSAMQEEMALRAGAEYALRNQQTVLDGHLPSNYEYLYPAPDELYTWTISSGTTKTGRGSSTADKWYLDDVTLNHDYEKHSTDVSVKFILDSANIAAQVIAEIAPDAVPWQVPAFNLLPAGPFPMLDSLMFPDGAAPAPEDEQPYTPEEVQRATTPSKRNTDPDKPVPAQDLPSVKKGNVVLTWNSAAVWICDNFTRTQSPNWRVISPTNSGITQAIFNPHTAGGFVISNDGTDTIVWRTDNILASQPTWNSTTISGVYTLIRCSSTNGEVYIYGQANAWFEVFDMTAGLGVWDLAILDGSVEYGLYIPGSGISHVDGTIGGDPVRGIMLAYGGAIPGLTGVQITLDYTAGGSYPDFLVVHDTIYISNGAPTDGTDVIASWSGSLAITMQLALQINSSFKGTLSGNVLLKQIRLEGTDGNPFGGAGALGSCRSTDGGASFGSPVLVGTISGDGGFDTIKVGDSVFAASDGQVETATSGGAYSAATGGDISGSYAKAIWAYDTDADDFLMASAAAVGGETLWDVVSGVKTAITPNDGSNDGVVRSSGALCTAPDNEDVIFFIGLFGGTVKLAYSTNGGTSWSFNTSVASGANYVRCKNASQVYIANDNNLLYSEDSGATLVDRTAPGASLLGVEVR